MSDIKVTQELDCSGMNCPLPVLKTQQLAKKSKEGDILKVTSTDPGSKTDIQAWARRNKHEVIEFLNQDDKFIYFIKI